MSEELYLPLSRKCVNCARYWSENDQMHTMNGAGECRKWYSQRSDTHLNKCPDFIPPEQQVIASAAHYCLRLRRHDVSGYRMEFLDPKAAKTIMVNDAEDFRDAAGGMLKRLGQLSSFLLSVSSRLSKEVPKSQLPVNHFVGTGDILSNPTSEARRRFATVVSVYPKSFRVSYEIIRIKKTTVRWTMKFVFAENGGCSVVFSSSENPNECFSPAGFAAAYDYGAGAVTIAAAELADFHQFIKSLKESGAKAAKRL